MKRRIMMLMMLALMVSGCGNHSAGVPEPDRPVRVEKEVVEEDKPMGVISRIPVREELLEPMMISEGVSHEEIVKKARDKITAAGLTLGFAENGGLPTPDSAVSGVRLKQSASYVYIYYLADGDANYDETELFSSVLAYLSVVVDAGFRVDTRESITQIFDGDREIAHFVLSGTQDSGYLMYYQIMD